MRFSMLITASILSGAAAFAPQISSNHRMAATSLAMSTENISYVITGNNIDVTPSLNEYVNKKLDKIVGKLSADAIQECDVHLSVNKNPKVKDAHTAEVVTFLKGSVIRCAETTPDMYASIDEVTDRLAAKLRKYKERRLEGYHGGPNMGENLAAVLDSLPIETEEDEPAAEEFVDPEAPEITKIKSYDLTNPISVEEAIFALDYVDHSFFVFREDKSNDINVIYKRNAGGYGLIGPQ